MKRRYPTDLSDLEWRCIEPYVSPPNRRGGPRIHSLRRVLDAVFYVLRSGCAWRLLPRGFPPWRVVLLLVQEMAHRGHLRAAKRSIARTPAKTLRQKRPTQCRDSGLPVRKDYRGRRRTTRLRRRQESAWQEASSAGGHRRLGSQPRSTARRFLIKTGSSYY